MLCQPQHMADVFQQEDKLAYRSSIDCIDKYRSSNTHSQEMY